MRKVTVEFTPKVVRVIFSREATVHDLVNALSALDPHSKVKSLQGFGVGTTAGAVLRFER